MKVRICVQIDGLAVDESGHPAPAGLEISMDVNNACVLPNYQELTQSVRKEGVLRLTGLDGFVKPEDMEFITPEEYDLWYGDGKNGRGW